MWKLISEVPNVAVGTMVKCPEWPTLNLQVCEHGNPSIVQFRLCIDEFNQPLVVKFINDIQNWKIWCS